MSNGISLTTNRTNFHEWGAASLENFLVGVIPSSFEKFVVQMFGAWTSKQERFIRFPNGSATV
jgi:hypothetical protein